MPGDRVPLSASTFNSSQTLPLMSTKPVQFIVSVGIFTVLIVGPLFLVKMSQFKAMAAAGAAMVVPATVVTATEAKESTWENVISSTGTLVAVQGVNISAEMPGKVVKIAFEPGATVKAGDLLIQ